MWIMLSWRFPNVSFSRDYCTGGHMKIFIHVGYAKCGSTSLQSALRSGTGVLFPSAGTVGSDSEHISLPLFLKGIDEWTRQFIAEDWVLAQHQQMLAQIEDSDQTVFLSSERLASLDAAQIETLREIFPTHEVEVIVITRNRDKYLESTWRHAVFRHDYSLPYDQFLIRMKDFSFGSVVPKFEKHFPVHVFNLDDDAFEEGIKQVTGAEFTFGRANVGVPRKLAELLQQQHALLGTAVFKEIFPVPVKNKMLFMMTRPQPPVLAPFNVPLF